MKFVYVVVVVIVEKVKIQVTPSLTVAGHLTKLTQTRLTSNPPPTTRECVHLVTCRHFQSCDKDGSHTVLSSMAEHPVLYANFMAVCFIEWDLLPIEVLHYNYFGLFARPTSTLTR